MDWGQVGHASMIGYLRHSQKWDLSLQKPTVTYGCKKRMDILVDVDDLLIASWDPQVIIDWLEKKNLFKLRVQGLSLSIYGATILR